MTRSTSAAEGGGFIALPHSSAWLVIVVVPSPLQGYHRSIDDVDSYSCLVEVHFYKNLLQGDVN